MQNRIKRMRHDRWGKLCTKIYWDEGKGKTRRQLVLFIKFRNVKKKEISKESDAIECGRRWSLFSFHCLITRSPNWPFISLSYRSPSRHVVGALFVFLKDKNELVWIQMVWVGARGRWALEHSHYSILDHLFIYIRCTTLTAVRDTDISQNTCLMQVQQR